MILIPVKNLRNAKQRLSMLLDASARTQLAQAMLSDVLEALAEFDQGDVSLVTSDPFALDLAGRHRFEIIRDDANVREREAIERATEMCVSRSLEGTLVIPADVPLLED